MKISNSREENRQEAENSRTGDLLLEVIALAMTTSAHDLSLPSMMITKPMSLSMSATSVDT